MSDQLLAAASGAGESAPKDEPQTSSKGRRSMLLALISLVLCLTVAPAALATSRFSWYGNGSGGTSCWREGVASPAGVLSTPATSSEQCLPVELPGHVVGGDNSIGGVGADIPLTQGDWCNSYRIDDQLGPDSKNEERFTGFSPGLSPVERYQLGDGAGNVCSTDGGTSGQAFTTSVPGSTCTKGQGPCGVQHYASLYSEGTLNSRPWNLWFTEPSLIVSTSVKVQRLTGSGYVWGYVCPILRDRTSGFTIEYCLEEWSYHYEPATVVCGTGVGNNDQIVVPMGNGSYASLYSGLGTFSFSPGEGATGWIAMAAQISTTNLTNAINEINSTCHPGLSADRADYQLIGVEQGVEGEGSGLAAGGSTKELQVSTIYNGSSAPTISSAPSIPQPIIGKADTVSAGSWSNSPTIYKYQWNQCNGSGGSCSPISGATSATYTPTQGEVGDTLTVTVVAGNQEDSEGNYAWSAPSTSSASTRIIGEPIISVGAATEIQQLQVTLNATVDPNAEETHYYFKYGKTTSYGKVAPALPGGNAGSGTSALPESVVVAGLEAATTYHYRLVATNSAGTIESIDHEFTTELMPKASFVESKGTRHGYYRGLNGQLDEWYWNGTTWSQHSWGYADEVVGTPSAVVLANGDIEVYYRATDGQLGVWWYGANFLTEWHQSNWGDDSEVAGSPSAIVLPNGQSDVFYRATDGQLGFWWFGVDQSTEWHQSNWGYDGEVVGAPAAVAYSSNAVDVYYQSSSGQLGLWWYGVNPSTEWHQSNWGDDSEVAGSPSAIVLPNGQSDVFYRATDGQLGFWWFGVDQSTEWHQSNWGYDGEVTGTPTGVAHSSSSVDVYYRSTSGQLGQWWYGASPTTEWHQQNWGYTYAQAGEPDAGGLAAGGEAVYYGSPTAQMSEWYINGSSWGQSDIGAW
jgi:hypothetical protein